MKKIIIVVVFIAALIMGGTGCMLENNSTPKKNIDDLALEYMENKYGEKFEYYAPCGASYSGRRTFLAKCESLEEKVLIQIDDYNDDNKRVFRDNYIAVKYSDQMSEYLENVTKEIIGFSKVFYTPSGNALSADLSPDADLEDLFNETEGLISAVVCISDKEYENYQQLYELANAIDKKMRCNTLSIILIVICDSEYESINEIELRKKAVVNDCVARLSINRDLGVTEFETYAEE